MTIRLDLEDNGIALLTLDNPENGNRLDRSMLAQLRSHLRSVLAADPQPHTLLISSVGDDFCLGRHYARDADQPRMAELDDLIELIGGSNQLLKQYPGVTIAAVQGRAVGAGLSLAGRCDIVVGEESAEFSFPEIHRGIAPTFVMSHFRYVLPRPILFDMLMTGRTISAGEGWNAGLISRVVPDGTSLTVAREAAEQLAAFDGEALRTIKDYISNTENMSKDAAVHYGNAVMIADGLRRSVRRD